MTAATNRNAPFRWNQDPTHAGKELPDIPFPCSAIENIIIKAIEMSPHKEVLGFEGQLTTFPCITQLQNKIASHGYRAVVCFNSQDAREKLSHHYYNLHAWRQGQHQIFVIKNRAYKDSN